MKPKYVFFVDQTALAEGVDGSLLGCPFVVLDNEDWPTELNDFLRDLFLGRWPPSNPDSDRAAALGVSRYRWNVQSIEKTAQRLVNFRRWCATPRMHIAGGQTIDPLRFTESDLDRYAKHQERGLWTDIEGGLRSSTIAHRQLAALEFRFWAASRGLSERPSFRVRVTSKKVGTTSGTKRKVSRTALVVVRRSDPALVRFPTPEEVNTAIESADADITAQLILKLIYFCGLRATEVCNLNLRTALSDELRSGNQYFIRVHGKNNKWRNIEIDKSLVEELENYKINYRPDLKSRIKTDAFLLNPDGCRFSYHQLWKLFKKYCGRISPHLGRHWYSIHYLVKAWQEQKDAAAADGLYIPSESAQALLSGPLIALQLNLGHAKISTTIKTYLVGLRQVLRQDRIAITFQDYLSSN